MDKSGLRKKIQEQRNKLTKEEVIDRSIKIKENLYSLREFKEARSINCYVSKGSEVFTHDILKENKDKQICVPCVSGKNLINSCLTDFNDLAKGCFGILEPKIVKEINMSKLDVVIVPGIVFATNGHRIGHGEGYYLGQWSLKEKSHDVDLTGLGLRSGLYFLSLEPAEQVPLVFTISKE